MMELRELLYKLGFIANILFALRFTAQWIGSEIKKKSELPSYFWRISLSANIIMFIHTLIQLQINVCLIQVINGIIAWRNLNFMQPKESQVSFRTVVTALGIGIAATFILFSLQGWLLLDGNYIFFRKPTTGGQTLGIGWHILGTLSYTLFSSRFWLQWWKSEKAEKSTVTPAFWIMSLVGAVISSIYFFLQRDYVNFIGPVLGLVPYMRNLILLRRSLKVTS